MRSIPQNNTRGDFKVYRKNVFDQIYHCLNYLPCDTITLPVTTLWPTSFRMGQKYHLNNQQTASFLQRLQVIIIVHLQNIIGQEQCT
jgi:hypothetical protein